MLGLSMQAFELRLWPHQHPLRQFEGILAQELLFKMEDRGLWMERLQVPFTWTYYMCTDCHCAYSLLCVSQCVCVESETIQCVTAVDCCRISSCAMSRKA